MSKSRFIKCKYGNYDRDKNHFYYHAEEKLKALGFKIDKVSGVQEMEISLPSGPNTTEEFKFKYKKVPKLTKK